MGMSLVEQCDPVDPAEEKHALISDLEQFPEHPKAVQTGTEKLLRLLGWLC